VGGSSEPGLVGNRNQTGFMVFLMAFGFQGWGFLCILGCQNLSGVVLVLLRGLSSCTSSDKEWQG